MLLGRKETGPEWCWRDSSWKRCWAESTGWKGQTRCLQRVPSGLRCSRRWKWGELNNECLWDMLGRWVWYLNRWLGLQPSPSLSPLFIYFLAKALKSGRFKLLSSLELTSLGRLEPGHFIIFVLPQPMRFASPTKLPVTPQLLLWDLPTCHMPSFSGPHWTWFVCPPWDRKFTRQAVSCFLHSPTGVVSRIFQVLLHCCVPCLQQGVFNRLCRPGPELAGGGEAFAWQMQTHIRRAVLSLWDNTWEAIPRWRGTLSFHYMKTWGTSADNQPRLSFISLTTGRYTSAKIRAKLESQQDLYKRLSAGVWELHILPSGVNTPNPGRNTEDSCVLLTNKNPTPLSSSVKKLVILVVTLQVLEEILKNPQYNSNLA